MSVTTGFFVCNLQARQFYFLLDKIFRAASDW